MNYNSNTFALGVKTPTSSSNTEDGRKSSSPTLSSNSSLSKTSTSSEALHGYETDATDTFAFPTTMALNNPMAGMDLGLDEECFTLTTMMDSTAPVPPNPLPLENIDELIEQYWRESPIHPNVIDPHANINLSQLPFLSQSIPRVFNPFEINLVKQEIISPIDHDNSPNATATLGASDSSHFTISPIDKEAPIAPEYCAEEEKSTSNDLQELFVQPQYTYVEARVYSWPVDDTTTTANYDVFSLKVQNLNARKISDSVKKTVLDEFKMQDRYLSETVYQRRLRIANEIHKRDYSRLSSSWYPLSIYKAYTNIKTDLDNTDYHKFVPRKSCFGKINMRSKRAWPRGPKRECAEESEHLGGPIIDNVRGSQRFAPY